VIRTEPAATVLAPEALEVDTGWVLHYGVATLSERKIYWVL